MAKVFENGLQGAVQEFTKASLTLHHPDDNLFISGSVFGSIP